ncbi:MAG TPA: SO2930 family diheme c-type cytochrome [Caulobacterales bacterium]|nr:SO2930 family diheme c-type cytochrome [Caulobacterales bacterium]
MIFARLAAAVLLSLALAASAQATAPPGVDQSAVMGERPPDLLSAYRFFRDPGARQPNAGVTLYDLNTPLYSDGALKFRYLYLPSGTQARYSATDTFDFPVGAVLIKTFAFAEDMRRPEENVRYLETRLLIHRAEGWIALAYVWNAEQTEARLSPIGADIPVSFTDTDGAAAQLEWAVPNRNQCAGCHAREGHNAVLPLGPTARNLNRDVEYPDYAVSGGHATVTVHAGAANQLSTWKMRGMLAGFDTGPDAAPRMANAYDAASGTLEQRARAYLQVNCAHCHNPSGPAHTSGLDLRDGDTVPAEWGVLKRPVAAGRGSADFDFDISPGHPDRSILIYRMESTDPGTMMPELGRTRIDQRAIALMREWIAAMGPDGRAR